VDFNKSHEHRVRLLRGTIEANQAKAENAHIHTSESGCQPKTLIVPSEDENSDDGWQQANDEGDTPDPRKGRNLKDR